MRWVVMLIHPNQQGGHFADYLGLGWADVADGIKMQEDLGAIDEELNWDIEWLWTVRIDTAHHFVRKEDAISAVLILDIGTYQGRLKIDEVP